MDILIDFDGTCVSHEYPYVGNDIGAVPILKNLVASGHNLILFTMRSYGMNSVKDGVKFDGLLEAVDWFYDNDIKLYGTQTNPTQSVWTNSPKAYGQLLIDDIALGAPLKIDYSISKRPFIDWMEVEKQLIVRGIL